jgi:hypothetical protein
VEPKLALHLAQQILVGLVEADPDESFGLLQDLARLLERDLADAATLGIGDAADDAHGDRDPA